MPGPNAKDPATRQRRNVPSTAADIEATLAREGSKIPPLGIYRPDERVTWHPETRRWWATIWASAIADRWIDAHLPGLRMLARLVDDYWRETNVLNAKQLLAEVRLGQREFGLSPMAARSMGWNFRRPQPAPAALEPLPPGADPRKILSLEQRRREA